MQKTQYTKNTILKKLNIQVEEHTAYKMGAPLIPINLGTEEPKPGDITITMVLRVSQKKLLTEYCWIHRAKAQSLVAGTPFAWKLFENGKIWPQSTQLG